VAICFPYIFPFLPCSHQTFLITVGAVLPLFGQSPCRKVGARSHFTDGPAVMPVLAWTCSPHTPIALLKPKQRTLHQKTEPFAAYIEKRWQKYWIPGRYLTVDEAIQRFLGRCTEAVTIPTKPDPVGIKEWCLGEFGYPYGVRVHIRGSRKHQGPQMKKRGKKLSSGVGIRPRYLTLLMSCLMVATNGGKGGLFTSTYSLSYARSLGVGMAGTCRTTKTRREKRHEKEVGIAGAGEVSWRAFLAFLPIFWPTWHVGFSDCFRYQTGPKKVKQAFRKEFSSERLVFFLGAQTTASLCGCH
jgi:hypothetical protein